MHSMLFVATIPPEKHVWADFVENTAREPAPAEGVLQLAENVWLLNLQKSIQPFGRLVYICERFGVSYGLLGFEHEPEWLPENYGSTPDTIPARSECG